MLANIDQYADDVLRSVSDGSYAGRLSYSTFFVTNSNGKRRRIERPSLYTRVLQHLSIRLIEPVYRRLDPGIAYNCKEGYGITASDSRKSLIHFLKHNVYERRDLHYALAIDQRKCYEHMTRKLYRKALKMLAVDTELVDFAVNVAFNGNSLPIGTPTSPFVHHVIMLAFDRWLGSVPGPKARYADDTLILFRTKEEATALVQYMYMVKELIDSGEPVMPLNNVEIENSCGYMFKGSTDREMYCTRDNISLPNSSVRK